MQATASPFQQALRAGMDSIRGVVGVRVEYRRGDSWVMLDAIPATSETASQESAQGFYSRVQMRDYLIDAEQLVLDGVRTTPTEGDEVIETHAGRRHVYEASGAGSGGSPWRYSDPGRTRFRVHTRLVSEGVVS